VGHFGAETSRFTSKAKWREGAEQCARPLRPRSDEAIGGSRAWQEPGARHAYCGEQRAFLGKGPSLFIVRVGDTVEGKIQVAAIDASEVKLRETSTNAETTIPLTKPAGSL